MTMRRRLLTILGLLGLGLAIACGSSSAVGPSPASDGGGGDDGVALPSGPLGGEAGPVSDAGPPPPQAFLRVAHLSPDLPPIDVCFAPHGTTSWSGPWIGQLSGGEAGAPGVTYAQVSAYLPLGPGQYDLRIVPAGSSSCSSVHPDMDGGGDNDAGADGATDTASADANSANDAASTDANSANDAASTDANSANDAGGASSEGGVSADAGGSPGVPDVIDLATLPSNANATLVIAGELSPGGDDEPLKVAIVLDDVQLAGGAASLRAINALPRGGPLDFGLGSFATRFTALLTDVAFAAASTQAGPSNGVVDPNGYLPIPPLSGDTLSARVALDAAGDTVVASSVDVPLGSIATVIAIGGSIHDTAHPPALLLCIDSQPSGGILSDCSLAP
jgi:hypothetical protein